MPRIWMIITVLLLCIAPAVWAEETAPAPPAVLSIIPAQGEPGTTILLSGSGFGERMTVFLATNEIPATIVSNHQLSFQVPKLPAGLYALFLKREDGVTSRTYSFSVLPVKPQVTGLSPDTIAACDSGSDRKVTVSGENFVQGSQVMFDGAGIKSRFLSPESISFLVPVVPGGLHQVQIKNPEDTYSGVLGLTIDSRPDIQSVTQGEDYVTYYNLIIEGTNFQQNSSLVVDGKRLQSSMSVPGERDRLVYVSCHKMIYQRFPYDPALKSFQLQIVNPNGEQSPLVGVNAP